MRPGRLAKGVSADGTVVVGASHGTNEDGVEAVVAFRWTATTGMIGLGTLDNPFLRASTATAVSADGSTVVGHSQGIGWRWTISDGLVELGHLPGQKIA